MDAPHSLLLSTYTSIVGAVNSLLGDNGANEQPLDENVMFNHRALVAALIERTQAVRSRFPLIWCLLIMSQSERPQYSRA